MAMLTPLQKVRLAAAAQRKLPKMEKKELQMQMEKRRQLRLQTLKEIRNGL